MVYIPFITAILDEDEPVAESNVCQFPRLVVALERQRHYRRALERCEESIAVDDPKSRDRVEAVRAVCSAAMLPIAQENLKEAEAELAMRRYPS